MTIEEAKAYAMSFLEKLNETALPRELSISDTNNKEVQKRIRVVNEVHAALACIDVEGCSSQQMKDMWEEAWEFGVDRTRPIEKEMHAYSYIMRIFDLYDLYRENYED